MGFSVKNLKLEYDLQARGKNAFVTKTEYKLPEGAQLKLAHKAADNAVAIGFDHKNFELKYNTKKQDLTAQWIIGEPGDKTKIKISQTVYNHKWETIPSPEIEFETQLFDGELKDALELKHDFDKKVSTIEEEFTYKKHLLKLHVDSATKGEGAAAEYKWRCGKKYLAKTGASFSKMDGLVGKYEARPTKDTELELKYNIKTDGLQFGLKYKGFKHVLLELDGQTQGQKIVSKKPKMKAGMKYTF